SSLLAQFPVSHRVLQSPPAYHTTSYHDTTPTRPSLAHPSDTVSTEPASTPSSPPSSSTARSPDGATTTSDSASDHDYSDSHAHKPQYEHSPTTTPHCAPSHTNPANSPSPRE